MNYFLFSHFNKYIVPTGQLGVFGWTKISGSSTLIYTSFLSPFPYQCSSVGLQTILVYRNYFKYHWENTLWKFQCPFLIVIILNGFEALKAISHTWLLSTSRNCLLCHLLSLCTSFLPYYLAINVYPHPIFHAFISGHSFSQKAHPMLLP